VAYQEDNSSNAGPTGKTLTPPAGGGGGGGTYVFASLDELDTIIAKWEAVRRRIQANGMRILQAQDAVVAPADNAPSRIQAQTLTSSLETGRLHNEAMFDYANAYIQKLRASRARYASDDQAGVDQLRRAGNA
jgi:hypothetical protein